MSDLTERLAAKLEAKGFVQFDAVLIGHKAHTVLPLLLSEPELVAGLPDEVRRAVLTPRERAVMRVGAAVLRPSVVLSNARADLGDLMELTDALAEAKAPPPVSRPYGGHER